MEKARKTKTKKARIFDIILLLISVCLFAGTCLLFYQRVYLTTFHVNGQSMWPTLNEFATDENGVEVGKNGGNSNIGYTVDVGVYDKHKSSLKKIKRFDIVSTLFPKRGDVEFIKRVIGLPGETIEFITGGENKGNLYVNGEFIEQPIKTEILKEGSYPVGEIKLGDDEYFVCGDNRGHSTDSRDPSVGNVKKEMLIGRVIAVFATGKIVKDEDGNTTVFRKDMKHKKVKFFI